MSGLLSPRASPVRQRLALCAGLGLAALGACSERSTSPSNPTSVTRSAITATLSPVPIVALQRSGVASAPQRFDLRAEITFHNGANIGTRITRLDLVALHSKGSGEVRSHPVNVWVVANGTAIHTVSDSVEVPSGAIPTAWHLIATGVDGDDLPVEVAPIAAPVKVEAQAPSGPDATIVAAGDIARCETDSHIATAQLVTGVQGTVLTLGDHVYPNGTSEQFSNCYERSWGRHRSRTRPAPGNHDWDADSGAPYFNYFGVNAGPWGQGYFSYDLGSWHMVSLNSNVSAGEGSAQLAWLRNDLARSSAACTLAYWHHPLFSSGPNGNAPRMADVWRVLDEADADVALVSHDHMYERFAPQDASGRSDPRGLRSFVVGTGGAPLYQVKSIQPNSEVRENLSWGVLKLVLRGRSYDWEFLPIAGQSFRDSGTAQCVVP
jgi:acid phosphatase type 7